MKRFMSPVFLVALLGCVTQKEGLPPIHWAMMCGSTETVEDLLRRDPSVANKPYEKEAYTPLFFACFDSRSAEILIQQGAEINYIAGDGRTPLHFAARIGNLPLVKLLVDKGVKIKVKDNQGLSPLDLAIKNKNEDCSEFLKQKGAKSE